MKNIVFDFDGVLFDTNKIKLDCFVDVAINHSFKEIVSFVDYCRTAGGITASERFTHYLSKVDTSCNYSVQKLTDAYRKLVRDKILFADPSPFLTRLYSLKANFNLSIISGGNTEEIIELLNRTKSYDIFNGMILGNPRSKDENFSLFCSRFDPQESIYIGDSLLDFHLAKKYNMAFRFIYGWTDLEDYENHPELTNAIKYLNISQVIDEFKKVG